MLAAVTLAVVTLLGPAGCGGQVGRSDGSAPPPPAAELLAKSATTMAAVHKRR